jgi:uncharacterized membrane protein
MENIFWEIVGVLLAAYNWFGNTIVRIGLTNWLLILLIYQVNAMRVSYFKFEIEKEIRYKEEHGHYDLKINN